MQPTRQQIEIAAYHRWERRGGSHGGDHDDWAAAEKDLVFGLNYRYLARYRLDGPAILLGKTEGRRRRCRFCEQAEPAVVFAERPPFVAFPGNEALRTWDECDDCRSASEAALSGAFASFARAMDEPSTIAEIPVGALKALCRLALTVLPADELHHFGDTIEWVTNPDHTRDARLLPGLGCHVYRTPAPVEVPFVALARRIDDDAPWPYVLVFLATPRFVFQTHLPLCNRDEDLDDDGIGIRGPVLSMSLGAGDSHRASPCVFLPVARPSPKPSYAGRECVTVGS